MQVEYRNLVNEISNAVNDKMKNIKKGRQKSQDSINTPALFCSRLFLKIRVGYCEGGEYGTVYRNELSSP